MCNYVYLIFLFVLSNAVFVISKKNGLMNSIFTKNILTKRKKKYNLTDYIKEFKLLSTPFQCIFKDGPDKLTITPEPILNNNGQLKVREGDTIGPFVCSADCNPPCNITWRVKYSDGFSDVPTEMGTVLQQAVQRNTLLFLCMSNWEKRILQQGIQLDAQCKYLIETRTV